MVDQVVIGFNDPHSAYHSADSIPPGGEDGIRVACSGGIGGGGSTPLCSRTRYMYDVPQCSRLCIRPAARCIPLASVMGIEPMGRWVWRPDRPPGRTLYDSFFRTTGWGI